MEALEDIPKLTKSLKTKKGDAHLQKTDIFRKVMWFGYSGENMWHPITTARVQEILDLNEKGVFPENLKVDQDIDKLEHAQAVTSDLDRLDRKYNTQGSKKKKKKSRKKRRKPNNRNKEN
jgi:hypothetical protein